MFRLLVILVMICFAWPLSAQQSSPSAFRDASSAFGRFSTERRVYIQMLLTAAGYWLAVPNVDFSQRLFSSIRQFQRENGFPENGILDEPHIARLESRAAPMRPHDAKNTYAKIADRYPIKLTRNLDDAREWLKSQARGSERYGLLASSGAMRLRPEGIHIKAKIDPPVWFLNDKTDVRSSYYCEEVASEFDVQGLELDWTGVCWDADFRYTGGSWESFDFKGTRWQRVRAQVAQEFLRNSYRVLLTRARQGMVIFLPKGSPSDATRPPEYYD